MARSRLAVQRHGATLSGWLDASCLCSVNLDPERLPLGDTVTTSKETAQTPPHLRPSHASVESEVSTSWKQAMRVRLVITDATVVVITVALARWIRFGAGEDASMDFDGMTYVLVSALLGGAWVTALAMTQSRSTAILGVGSEEYRRVISATFGVFGLMAIISMIFKLDIARGYIAVALPLGLAALLLARRFWRVWLVSRRLAGGYSDRALLIGHRSEVAYVMDQIDRRLAAGYRVIGAVLDQKQLKATDVEPIVTSSGAEVPVVGDLNGVVETVQALGASSVIVAGNVGSRTFLKTLGWELEKTGASLVLASRLTDIAGPRIHWRPIDGLPLMRVELPQYTGVRHSMKRLMDILMASAGIVVAFPLLVVIGLLVKLEDGGPILFRQARVGVNGRRFMMHKFRSMRTDAETLVADLSELNEGNGKLFKIRNDPRVTRVGSFIRRYSLDELPQLWDVLRGSMSLVGPRPPLPREVADYEKHIHRRLNVRPGITGLWQVSGRSDLSWDESVRLDLYYVENWSPAGDILILFKTVRAVLTKDGAY